MLGVAAVRCWRAFRVMNRTASALSAYATEESAALQSLALRLNEHAFTLQHTSAELLPKLERIGSFLEQPLIAASLPWLFRRMFGRPYKKRS